LAGRLTFWQAKRGRGTYRGQAASFIGGTGTATGSAARVNESEQTVRLSPVSTLK
jgi:hypothetical protein